MQRQGDAHQRYERKQVIWLFFTFVVIALMAGAVMVLGAWEAGWRPGR